MHQVDDSGSVVQLRLEDYVPNVVEQYDTHKLVVIAQDRENIAFRILNGFHQFAQLVFLTHNNEIGLNQLAHILIDNAVKYSEKQGVVKICLSNKGDKIEFSVNNKGNVISPEDLEHIFDRFYRAEKSRSTKGYGLGLAIAQSIVQSMNGKLTAESDAENGTTFTAEFKTGK